MVLKLNYIVIIVITFELDCEDSLKVGFTVDYFCVSVRKIAK